MTDISFLRSLTIFLTFKDSSTKSTSFARSFKSSASDPEPGNLIQALESSRNDVLRELSSPTSTTAVRIVTIEQYLPLVHRLLYSLSNQGQVNLDADLLFKWRGPVTITDKFTEYQEIIYEYAMALVALAFFRHKMASELIAVDFTSVAQAGVHLRTATGIMTHLSESILPSYVSKYGRMNLPPECDENVCLLFAHYFKAATQMLVVVNAMIKPSGTPAGVMVKLCQGVVMELDRCIDVIVRKVSPNFTSKIDNTKLRIYFAAMRGHYQALAYKYQAEFKMLDADLPQTGLAIAYCDKALVRC